MKVLDRNFKFIDLFSGIGGFHYSMKKISEESICVLASEINTNAIKMYKKNHKISSNNNILDIDAKEIENFDVLCGGFPCQSFSKAGNQSGFNDARGTLFFEIVRILDEKNKYGEKPKLIILENVKNLVSHDEGRTWSVIYKALTELGYNTIKTPLVVSPADFGIPQIRERAVILAIDRNIYDGNIDFNLILDKSKKLSVDSILDPKIKDDKLNISEYENKVLEAWNFFIKNLNKKTIGFPIWSDEFGLDYELTESIPDWKKKFIIKNRELYLENKEMIDQWKKDFQIEEFVKTHRKFEWQASTNIDSVFKGIIQFRPSGVRVKKPNVFPTLVAMAHIPIIGKYRRYISPREAARLQSLPEYFDFKSVGNDIYRLLGNAVNVEVMYQCLYQFIDYIESKIEVI